MDKAELTRLRGNFSANMLGHQRRVASEHEAILDMIATDAAEVLKGIHSHDRQDARIIKIVTDDLGALYGDRIPQNLLFQTLLTVADRVAPDVAEEWRDYASEH